MCPEYPSPWHLRSSGALLLAQVVHRRFISSSCMLLVCWRARLAHRVLVLALRFLLGRIDYGCIVVDWRVEISWHSWNHGVCPVSRCLTLCETMRLCRRSVDVVKNGMFCFELNKSKCEANYDDILCKCSRHCFLFVFGLRVFLSIAEVIASGVPNVSMRAKARDRKEVGEKKILVTKWMVTRSPVSYVATIMSVQDSRIYNRLISKLIATEPCSLG